MFGQIPDLFVGHVINRPPTPSDDEYEVERIVGTVQHEGRTLYRLRYVGYDSDQDTLEPLENLRCPRLLQQFYGLYDSDGRFCPICGKMFDRTYHTKRHLVNVHRKDASRLDLLEGRAFCELGRRNC